MIGQALSKLKRTDSVLWSIDVGRMHARNNIIVAEDRAYLSSCGESWNSPDGRDGVYCVDLSTTSIRWFTQTRSDANEIALIEEVILTGTDQGMCFAIDAATGKILAEASLDDAIVTRPLEIEIAGRKAAILISRSGTIVQYNFQRHQFISLGSTQNTITANPIAIDSSSILVGCDNGVVQTVSFEDNTVKLRKLFELPRHKASSPYTFSLEVTGISSLIKTGDRIIASYIRNTYDRRPPISCFSYKTGEKLWDAGRIPITSKDERATFGNSRVVPVLYDGMLFSTFSYNDSIHAFSLHSGKWAWRKRLDSSYFQNWASPIRADSTLYVPRINGVISVIDLHTKELRSSFSVEVFDVNSSPGDNFATVKEREPWPINRLDYERGPFPGQEILAGICSTPTPWKDQLLVGTVSGKLVCLNVSGRQSRRTD